MPRMFALPRIFVLLGLLPVVAAAQPKDAPPKPVIAAEVTTATVTTGQSYVGTVMPSRRATVGSAVAGRVLEFPIDEGMRVEERQPLAQILTETIKLELAAAEAELRLKAEELRELRNGSRPEEIEQARAAFAAAGATDRYQQARFKRTENLYQRGSVTEEAFDEVRSLAAATAQQLKSMEAAYKLAQAGPRQEKILQAEATLAMHEAMAEKLKDQIKKYTVVARFAGYVVAEYTEVGAWVNQGDPVAEIIALDEVDVTAQVPEFAIPFVTTGQEVRVEIPSLPERLLTGTVVGINPQADTRSRTFPVKVRVTNEIGPGGPVIKAGMLARVVLPTGAATASLLVPKDALVLGGPRPAVFIATPDAKLKNVATVAPVPVEIGVASGRRMVVSGDLKPGQLVIVRGNERLRPGDTVTINEVVQDDAGER